jgi:hypothetical protein
MKKFNRRKTCAHVYEQRRKRAVWIKYTKRCYTVTSIQDNINSSVFVISTTEQYMYKKKFKKKCLYVYTCTIWSKNDFATDSSRTGLSR